MKINQLASKPQLIKLVLNDPATIESIGEELEFWTWDRQPLDQFMKLASLQGEDALQALNIVKTLILDEDGKEVISNEVMLPTSILIRVIQKVVETLGK
jgi:hypothetical protein